MRTKALRAAGAVLHSTPRRLIVALALAAGDCAAAVFASMTATNLWSVITGAAPTIGLGLPDVFLLLGCLGWFGLYHGLGLGPVERLRARVFGICSYFGLRLFIVSLFGSTAGALAPMIVMAAAMLLLSFYAEFAIRNQLIAAKLWAAPVVVYGLNSATRGVAEQLKGDPIVGLQPIAFAAPRETAHGEAHAPGAREGGLTVLNNVTEYSALQQRPEALVVIEPHHRESILAQWPHATPRPRILLARTNAAYDRAQQATCAIGNYAVVNAATGTANRRRISWAKRAFDVMLAVPLMLLALPVLAILALAVKLADPGPAFYTQPRVGRHGRSVDIFKLRTMYLDSETRLQQHLANNAAARTEWHRFFKLKNDPRIIRGVGALLRRTSLDELPQLWNVIRGDISLIGPRPFPDYHMQSFDQQFRALRTSVQPGLTGLWQVSERSNGDLTIQRACDLRYIEHWSPWLDLYILLATPLAVVSGRGAR